MAAANTNLCHKYLQTHLDYNPETGVFIWIKRTTRSIKVGSVAGSPSSWGYIQIKIARTLYKAHRLAWYHHYGKWPKGPLDHINGIRTDNRICNLRECTPRDNAQNRRTASPSNKTGLLGVTTHARKGYCARIRIDGMPTYIGIYSTPEEAHEAYLDAKRKHHKMCTI